MGTSYDNEMNFKELRNKLNYTQEVLSQSTGIPVSTIRRYDKGAVPSPRDMIALVVAMHIELETLVAIYEKNPMAEELHFISNEVRLRSVLEADFGRVNSIQMLSQYYRYFKKLGAPASGVIAQRDCLFFFSQVDMADNGSVIVLSDDRNNRIVLTGYNVKAVRPLMCQFDVYTFEVVVKCAMFPVPPSEKVTADQTLTISFFAR